MYSILDKKKKKIESRVCSMPISCARRRSSVSIVERKLDEKKLLKK